MKNEYYYNNIKIKDINNKMLILINENVLALNKDIKIQTKCHLCGNLSKPIRFYYNKDSKEYICPKCRGLYFNPFKGKHHTEKYKKEVSLKMKGKYKGEKNPMYGKNIKDYMTPEKYEEWKNKISNSVKGEKNPMYGKNIKDYMTPEKYEEWKNKQKKYRDNLSEEQKQQWINKIKESNQKRKLENYELYIQKKKFAGKKSALSQSKYKKSKIEEKVENWLKENKINYEYSCIMGFGDSCFQYDFIIYKKRILIEVQGDYWHGNPNMFNNDGSDGKRILNNIQKLKMEKDIRKQKFANDKGFNLIYIWEKDIKNNDFSVLEFLKND